MNNEIWKAVVGYEGKYEVSSIGRVRSIPRYVRNSVGSQTFVEGKILTASKDKAGYIHVSLSDSEYKTRRWSVHRLVAIAFLKNPDNLPVVNHKDENKSNNCVENLEWCSQSYNLSYKDGQKKRRQQKIEMYNRETGEYIKTFNSIDEASKETGTNRTTISQVASNNYGRRSAGGYIWRYAKDSIRERRGLRDEIVVLKRYPRKRKIEMLNKETEEVIRIFNSISEAAKTLNISERQIQGVCSHKKYQHSAGGYKWRYAD